MPVISNTKGTTLIPCVFKNIKKYTSGQWTKVSMKANEMVYQNIRKIDRSVLSSYVTQLDNKGLNEVAFPVFFSMAIHS